MSMPTNNAVSLPGSAAVLQIAQSRKRKRDDEKRGTLDIDQKPFVLTSAGETRDAEPRVFVPLCLLSRANLPLAWLDTLGDGSKFFTSSIGILNTCHELGVGYCTLVAEERLKGRFFAIERVDRNVFALCRLSALVSKAALEQAARVVLSQPKIEVKRQAVENDASTRPWWMRAAVHMPDQDRSHLNPLQQTMPTGTNTLKDEEVVQPHCDTQNPRVDNPLLGDLDPNRADTRDTCAQDPFQDLAKQYLDTVYLSRTSLAYFVKGPLSRARAAFSGIAGSERSASDLAAFLRDMTLSCATMDKKYRESILSVISQISEHHDGAGTNEVRLRRKPKWKRKRGRTGFFTIEAEYLQKWWYSDENDAPGLLSPETVPAAVKRRTPHLRNRETYLQIILILEIMSLETASSTAANGAEASSITAQETQTKEMEIREELQAQKKRSKKPADLQALLETLLDRLTIWYSVETHSPAKKSAMESKPKDEANDELRNFCVEVIVPFYLSRTPKGAALVNKKLGGPSHPTPIKRSSSSRKAPGQPSSRQHPTERQPRRPLHRIGTDSLATPSTRPTPTLQRSATDSLLQRNRPIKRESSVSLSIHSIPAANSDTRKPRPSALASLSRREIDLAAVSAATEEKLRKKAEQEEKIREAIAGIKKPNRAWALKENAERVDAKFATATSRRKQGSSMSIRNGEMLSEDNVHVAATPKTRRTIAATPRRKTDTDADSYPSVGTSGIPSSTARFLAPPSKHEYTSLRPLAGDLVQHALGVQETPSRATTSDNASYAMDWKHSPVIQRSRAVACTPSKPRTLFNLAETPIARHKVDANLFASSTSALPPAMPLGSASPNAASKPQGGKKSVYAVLGWDEEDFEELA